MSNPDVDLSFCDTCSFRGTLINGVEYCARTGMDIMQQMVGRFAGKNIVTFGGTEPSTPAEELEVSFGAEFLLSAVNCIESVSAGGPPVAVAD